MTREYLRVTPTSANLDPDTISTALSSLRKLSPRTSDGFGLRFNPFRSPQPLTFEFVAVSDGPGEPVEFYYGADDQIDALQQRLRTIYPSSFDVDRVDIDLLEKLLEPREYRPDEANKRLEQGERYTPDAVGSTTNQDGMIGADGGMIRARPSLDDVTPYGVRWRGSVDRRKDWMTSLTDFGEMISGPHDHYEDDDPQSGRAPLAPLIDQLTAASQPLAFQVVFQRKPDWSSQARRRSGALLAGKDTLLQKLLSIGSPDQCRTRNERPHHRGDRTRGDRPAAPQSGMRDRERDQKTETRLDQLRENTPKRSFTANARLLALPTSDDDLDDLEARLDILCSVFDTLDGPFYEIEGERFRDGVSLARTTERRARRELDRFRTRSIATRRRDRVPRLTNRSDSRLDIVIVNNADKKLYWIDYTDGSLNGPIRDSGGSDVTGDSYGAA